MPNLVRNRLLPALLLAIVGCGGSDSTANEAQRASGPARRIVLVTCDTLRADHMGLYGCARPTTPRLDELARECVVFDNAFSAASLTNPSVSSLLSGLLPDECGASPTNVELMPSTIETIAEVARRGGLDTAGFVANIVLARAPAAQGDIGVSQGFTHFDDKLGAMGKENGFPDRSAKDLTDAVVAWMDARKPGDDRFFLWVHYMDPHGPYTPPAEDLAAFARDHAGEPDLPLAPGHSGSGGIPVYQALDGVRRAGDYVDRYDAEIHAFDAQVGRLVDELRERQWLDDSLFVFTADHGESLGEHGYWFCHGETLHRELVRVPLLVRPPRDLRAKLVPPGGPKRVTKLAMHLDVWPTIVEAAGLHTHTNRGLSLLMPRLPDGRIAAQFLGRVDERRHFSSVTDGRWHLMRESVLAPRLFDMLADPAETKNVAELHPNLIASLQERYTTFLATSDGKRIPGTLRQLDETSRRGLGATGYAEGDGSK